MLFIPSITLHTSRRKAGLTSLRPVAAVISATAPFPAPVSQLPRMGFRPCKQYGVPDVPLTLPGGGCNFHP